MNVRKNMQKAKRQQNQIHTRGNKREIQVTEEELIEFKEKKKENEGERQNKTGEKNYLKT